MNQSVVLTIILFVLSLTFNLVGFIATNIFIKKMDKLADSFDKLSDKLEQFVKKQDYKDDVDELKRRLEKLETRQNP